MAKKGLGKFVMLAAIAGTAAAGISYLKKYQSFNKNLDEDFHDFEDEEEMPVPDSTMSRNYVSLNSDKDELFVAAGNMLNAAKDVAGAAKNVVKDAAAIVADTTREAMGVACDYAAAAKTTDMADTAQRVFTDGEDAVVNHISDDTEELYSDQ